MSTHNIYLYKENQNTYHTHIIKNVPLLGRYFTAGFSINFEKLKRTIW